MNRNSFLTAVILLVMVVFLGNCNSESSGKIYFYVGSYTEASTSGIYYCELNQGNGEIRIVKSFRGIKNPSFLAFNPGHDMLYAVGDALSEPGAGSKNSNGSVYSLSIDKESGSLQILNSVTSGGAHPCHLSVDATGRYVLVANYTGGNIEMIPVSGNKQLGEPVGLFQHEGSGPNTSRQEKPHAHSINISPGNNMAYACDLGTDEVIAYKMNTDEGWLMPDSAAGYKTKPGAGPRHFTFSPDGKLAFVINELNSTLVSFSVNDSGALHEVQVISTLPDGYTGESYCADVHVHPNGKYVYGSNRGHNSIAVFALESSGRLELIQHQNVSGDWPRNFAITPSGDFLLVANRRSDNIVVFRIDETSGMLSETGQQLSMSEPVCIVF